MKYQYAEYQKHITLLDGVDDIQPYLITLPDPPPIEEFVNYGLPPEKQFFKREQIPTKVKNLNFASRAEALLASEKDPDISGFVEDQWNKRINGVFQIIHGVPMHIVGLHWFYLNYFPIDIGLPSFRITDRDYWYWRKFCVWDNPRVYGGINFTGRRFGKSAMAGCETVEVTTRRRLKLSGIQSKTDDDAEQLFNKFIKYQVKKLPWYFKPIYDTQSTKDITMEYPKGSDDPMLEPLNSKIDFRSSNEIAYDGEKLLVYIMDEAGKYKKSDPYATWDKVKYCFKDEDSIVGKAIVTSTVEELEKGGGRKFQKLFNESSLMPEHGQINDLGQTNSGLIPYFTPAFAGYIYDQYGWPIIDMPLPYQQKYRYERLRLSGESHESATNISKMGAKELLLTERKNMKSHAARQDHQRKYPFSIKEAFTSAFKTGHFNPEKIQYAKGKFLYGSPYNVVPGNFMWKDGVRDSEVIFCPNPNGRWLASYLVSQDSSNKKEMKNGSWAPVDYMKGSAGCDPYKFGKLSSESNKPSMGSGYVWWNYDEFLDGDKDEDDDTRVSDDFICEYIYRQPDRDMYNEDMLMMCVFYGVKMFPETNVDHTAEYFVKRGYGGYLLFQRKAKKVGKTMSVVESEKPGGYSTGDKMKDPIFAHMEWYVENRIWRCKFIRLINDIDEVEYEDTRKYDAFMGAGNCIYGVKMINKKPGQSKKTSYSLPIDVVKPTQS